MPNNNYLMETESDLLYDPARYTGIDQVVVDNDNDTIGLSASFISTVNNKLDSATFASYTANHASDDITPYSGGSNINITNHVVSGKDWANEITSATSGKLDTSTYNTFVASTNSWDKTPYSAGANINITNHVVSGKDWSSDIGNKLDTSTYNTYTATHANDDNTPYSAGSNINITNHVISGKDWSSDITNAISGKIDKVTGGAGAKTNPVYLSNTNVVTPCFTEDNSVKFTPSEPAYFSGDRGGNVFLHAPTVGSTFDDVYGFKNSIVLGRETNYRRSSTSKEKYDNCIFMNGYFYGAEGTTGKFSYNTLIGYNSMTNVKQESYGNTVIGQYNDVLLQGDNYIYADTLVGYQNNIYGDGYEVSVVGASNEIGQHRSGLTKHPFHSVVAVGSRNDYQPLDASNCYDAMMLGFQNSISHSGNYRNMAIGYSNSISGNCNYLIGDSLSANNEGSYSNKVMKIGMGNTFLKVESSGSIKQVINGTANEIQNKLTGITDVQVVTAMPVSPVANVLYLVKV